MTHPIELGLDTFGDITVRDGKPNSHAQVLRDLVEEAKLADVSGVDFLGLGEHHRADYAVSAIEPILGAIAAQTTRLRFGSAVTVLSSDDPIRLFQRFATLAALSDNRAEIILGRGSFTESFPLFGFDLSDYEKLFEEKLDLFAKLLASDTVSWSGSIRPPLKKQGIWPQPEKPLRTWIGVGGSPDSVVRAATFNMPMLMAIIGGNPARFRPYAQLYREAHESMDQAVLPIGVHSMGHVAMSDKEAQERYFAPYCEMHDLIGKQRGWPRQTRAQFDQEIAHGSLYVGSPTTVATKIAATLKVLGASRFQLKYSAGPMEVDHILDHIKLYGEEVIPRVREMMAKQDA
ncbi:Limonene 1,2-monooxygenase [Aquimixticola soesokkakensis]|uniref:Limonene 1,2-monooxygenase n=1 Tax=Aquimixticola soesokkakensis TaxID=1519096 RepID=A0A1Y5RKG7_9RHOB|nr:LLM class flavin-dependent oxidoreductase [Aquimixticola soesokkakensis]SLN16798.1 Limonene 1,2-monooxygenase [Aquimixticola soesokkakensis]